MAKPFSDIPESEYPELPRPEDLEGIVLGPPFAMCGDCELLERDASTKCDACHQPQVHGAVALIRCECGQPFRIDLLTAGVKPCPKCERVYTHALLVANVNDDEIFADALAHVLTANGFAVPAPREDEQEPEVVDGELEETEPESSGE